MSERTLKDIMRDHRMIYGEGQGAWGGGLCNFDGDVYPCDVRRVIRARIGDLRAIEAEAAATSSPAGNGEPLKCSDCGPYAPCPKHDEGTRDAAPGLTGSVCKCGLAKSYHDGRLAQPDEYEPRYPSVGPRTVDSYTTNHRIGDVVHQPEAPPGGLDMDRLHAALEATTDGFAGLETVDARRWAADIAAEYARLSPTPGQGDSGPSRYHGDDICGGDECQAVDEYGDHPTGDARSPDWYDGYAAGQKDALTATPGQGDSDE